MASLQFHVAIDGPAGMSFPSFPSSALEGGNVSAITLDMIRYKCNISNKLFFTIDGKNRIGDTMNLEYYMSLSAEQGQEILDLRKAETLDDKKKSTANDGPKADSSEDKGKPLALPGIRTFLVKVGDPKSKRELVPLPAQEALSKVLDSIGNDDLKRGTLPTFADRQLASLAANYATNTNAKVYAEPSELTEEQWDSVLKNNRAFHGYWYDFNLGTLVKAAKPAFRLRGAPPVGKAPATTADKPMTKEYFPPIPPFFVHDDANVHVTEVRSQTQSTWVKEGFNSVAVGGSLGGGPSSVPVSVEASYDKEHAFANQERKATDVSSLAVTYSFTRAVVELDPDCLELTEQCRQDAYKVTSPEAEARFYRQYGVVFVTRLTLGGYLHSKRNVTSAETANLDQVKDKVRMAAGISIQTPYASGGANFARVDSKTEETGQATLQQSVSLAWDAHGGDTLLCSNPPAWASTVKDHRLWRLMDQERFVKLEYLIKDVDTAVWQQLQDHSSSDDSGKDITDPDFNAHIRVILMNALIQGSETNTIVNKMSTYYQSDTGSKVKAYNAFMQSNFRDEVSALIKTAVTFSGLTLDQKVGFGLYMTSLGELRFN